jgi:hypothetical protein
MAEAAIDPRSEPQAAVLRELSRADGWRQKRRDTLAAASAAGLAWDAWCLDHPEAEEGEREAQRKALKLERFEDDVAQFDRLIAGQAARIESARKRLDEANWSYFLAEEKPLQARGRELLAEALRVSPVEWRKLLPELQLIAILIARGRQDVAYLNRPSQMPENLIGLPGYFESVPQLMRFFSLMPHKLMNGLARRQIVKEPS